MEQRLDPRHARLLGTFLQLVERECGVNSCESLQERGERTVQCRFCGSVPFRTACSDDVAGDLEIETFPSILVGQGSQAKFLGPVLPQTGVLARMLQSLPQDAAARPADVQEAQDLLQRLLRADDLQEVLR